MQLLESVGVAIFSAAKREKKPGATPCYNVPALLFIHYLAVQIGIQRERRYRDGVCVHNYRVCIYTHFNLCINSYIDLCTCAFSISLGICFKMTCVKLTKKFECILSATETEVFVFM